MLCFDPSHGHRTPATAWAEGHAAFLSRLEAMLDVVAPEFIAWIEGAWEGAGQYVDLSQGGFWPDLPGAEYFPQMYRYTLPSTAVRRCAHGRGAPLGSHGFGRNRAINAQVGDPSGTASSWTTSLETSSTEGHWFLAEDEAVVTAEHVGAGPVSGYPDLRRAGKQSLPTSARAIAAEQDVAPVIWENHVVFEVSVPARQMEAVHLRW